jgi:3-dehydroquinate synthase
MERLTLRHPRGESAIVVGAGALAAAADELARWWQGRRVFVVSSAPIAARFAGALEGIEPAGAALVHLEVPDGETAKTVEVARRLWEGMLAAGGKRDSRVVALGGGTVGDVAGFVAATFLRGIELTQIPTTLLAQVDAAIGGKTAIDLPGGKNSVGAFHHPHLVVADTELLASLPRADLRAGLVEVVKMATLLDPGLLDVVEEGLDGLLDGDPRSLDPVVARAIRAKVGVVEDDPEESDRRRLLNLGHTLGHAIEAVLDYRGLRHGEAVAFGLLFALRLARRRGLGPDVARRLVGLLGRFELPPLPPLAAQRLVDTMARDKKARESGIVWVLPVAMGEGRAFADVPLEEVERELEAFLREPFKL